MKIGLLDYGLDENGEKWELYWEDLTKKDKWILGIVATIMSPFSWVIGYLIYYFFKEVL